MLTRWNVPRGMPNIACIHFLPDIFPIQESWWEERGVRSVVANMLHNHFSTKTALKLCFHNFGTSGRMLHEAMTHVFPWLLNWETETRERSLVREGCSKICAWTKNLSSPVLEIVRVRWCHCQCFVSAVLANTCSHLASNFWFWGRCWNIDMVAASLPPLCCQKMGGRWSMVSMFVVCIFASLQSAKHMMTSSSSTIIGR